MGLFSNLFGTTKTTFQVSKAKFDAAILSALRTISLPDSSLNFTGGSTGDVLTKGAGGIAFATPSAGGGTGTFLSGASNITGTYNGGLYVDGNATLTGNVTVKGNFYVLGNIINTGGYTLTVNGTVICTGALDFTNTGVGGATATVDIKGDLIITGAITKTIASGSETVYWDTGSSSANMVLTLPQSSPKITVGASMICTSSPNGNTGLTAKCTSILAWSPIAITGETFFDGTNDTGHLTTAAVADINALVGASVTCTSSPNGHTGLTAIISSAVLDTGRILIVMDTNWVGTLTGDVFDWTPVSTGADIISINPAWTGRTTGDVFSWTQDISVGVYMATKNTPTTFKVAGNMIAKAFWGVSATDSIAGMNIEIGGNYYANQITSVATFDKNNFYINVSAYNAFIANSSGNGGSITIKGIVSNTFLVSVGGYASTNSAVPGNGGAITIGEYASLPQAIDYSGTYLCYAPYEPPVRIGDNPIEATFINTLGGLIIHATNTQTGGVGGAINIAGNCVIGNNINTSNCTGWIIAAGGFRYATGSACAGGAGGNTTIGGNALFQGIFVKGGNCATSGNGGASGSFTCKGNVKGGIYAMGGDATGTSNTAGRGGDVYIFGDCNGNITTTGYDASATATANGGRGGDITVGGNHTGSGTANGRTSSSRNGGQGGTYRCYGNLINGSVTVYGGNAPTSYSGGAAGLISIYGDAVKCNGLDSHGGNGSQGLNGGTITIDGNAYMNSGISINSYGGNGLTNNVGGDGGEISIGGFIKSPSGSINAYGGNASGGGYNAGAGANVSIGGGCVLLALTNRDGTTGLARTTTVNVSLNGFCKISTITTTNRAGFAVRAGATGEAGCLLLVEVMTGKTTLRKGSTRATETGALSIPGYMYQWAEGATYGWYRYAGTAHA